jgi:hypothetical protein
LADFVSDADGEEGEEEEDEDEEDSEEDEDGPGLSAIYNDHLVTTPIKNFVRFDTRAIKLKRLSLASFSTIA